MIELTNAGGAWTGQFHTLVDEVDSNEFGSVTNDGNQWTFAVPDVAGSPTLVGTLSGDGQTLSGEGNRGGTTFPFEFSRVGDAKMPPAGYWQGGLIQGGAIVLRINLNIVAAPCGQVLVTMDSPDQGASGMAVTGFEMRGDSMLFDMAYVGGSFEGTVSSDGSELKGTWRQGGSANPLELKLGEAPEGPNRPQEPQPPFPYHVEDVTYENAAAGIELAGTLTMPSSEGPHPAVILISGSGAQDRDESLMGHKPFLLLADHLTRRGIAVLRYDDRGVGGSGGNTMLATLQDNATDVEAAIAFLNTRPEIDGNRIGLMGHSEGGWVSPLVAMTNDDVSFIVMLAGPGVSAEDLLFAQQEALLTVAGVSSDYIEGNALVSKVMFDILREDDNPETVNAELIRRVEVLKQESTPAQRDGIEQVMTSISPEQWQSQIQTMTTPWFRGLLAYDPTEALHELDVPVLALIGELDLQVPPGQNVPALEEAFANGKATDYTVRVLPQLNHLFQTAKTGAIDEYAQIEETMSPVALEIISDWILERVGR
jgi:pimeloyl-ACP methyl ester carboxylesterase